jgi:nicotinamide-nucleotide amidase
MTTSPGRPLRVAELLSIGSELTVGETRDTNSGELARELTRGGVRVARIQALPDRLETVRDAFLDGLGEADLVISTGGLGPTPDDLTREAIAAALGETPEIQPELEAWLRDLWARRNLPFAPLNLKQAWLIPSATAIPNPNGTAPGWWVDAPEGRVIVAMPGPPREMRPMWADWALPRLVDRGLGAGVEIRTLRLTGIGESQIAQLLGEPLLRSTNPIVATYARAEAVDVRISAVAETAPDGSRARTAAELADEAESAVLSLVGSYLWARGETTWAGALDDRLAALGWRLATLEIGTQGALMALLSEMERLVGAESRAAPTPTEEPSRTSAGDAIGYDPPRVPATPDDEVDDALPALARALRDRTRADVALAVRVTPRGEDTSVEVAIDSPAGSQHERRLAFLRGTMGRNRAAITAAALLLERLPAATSVA